MLYHFKIVNRFYPSQIPYDSEKLMDLAHESPIIAEQVGEDIMMMHLGLSPDEYKIVTFPCPETIKEADNLIEDDEPDDVSEFYPKID